MLLTTAYLPPIEYFALLAKYSVVYVEACETYQKQSWRNRCRILTANGPQDLNVPVVHENGTFHLPITQIKVDYSTPWVLRMQRAIESAYYSSPFFVYYRDALFDIMDSRPETLWELNSRLTTWLCGRLGIAPEIRATEDFSPEPPMDIHPKHPNTILRDLGLDRPYWQVFRERYGFVGGLSVIDLLFNEGPESICWLVN